MIGLPTQNAICGYAIMWLYVMFDLPVVTKRQRKVATDFRKWLLNDGYAMHQYSVYIRHCASQESCAVHIRRLKARVPDEGVVSVLRVTDKQFGDTLQFVGRKAQPPPKAPIQLEFF